LPVTTSTISCAGAMRPRRSLALLRGVSLMSSHGSSGRPESASRSRTKVSFNSLKSPPPTATLADACRRERTRRSVT
jgi:hypothetical protein